ncbi:hypothetical protein OB955_22185 [Halobacteria archaeon AArc-m2/3/4]|uniref:Uncharacterized protein n=1 Tax=Natronoglomus mannanivorans TaxID=2979990 RepID=A0ABT2QKE8_9EURY|nr:hypothetical protein [Halobacteria archaeon AArc-m2/3/4]
MDRLSRNRQRGSVNVDDRLRTQSVRQSIRETADDRSRDALTGTEPV